MFFHSKPSVAPTQNLQAGSGFVGPDRQQLAPEAYRPLSQGVTVRAHSVNRHLLFVGLADGQGVPLAAGESVSLPVDDPTRLQVWSSAKRRQSFSWWAI
jgi:hypothetical protein